MNILILVFLIGFALLVLAFIIADKLFDKGKVSWGVVDIVAAVAEGLGVGLIVACIISTEWVCY